MNWDSSIAIAFPLLLIAYLIYASWRQNVAMARQREAMEVQDKAVATQDIALAKLERLVELAEEANRQRAELLTRR